MQCLTSGKRRGVSNRSRERDQLASYRARGVATKICDGRRYLLSFDVADAITHRLDVGRGANGGGRNGVRSHSIRALRLRHRAHQRDDAGLRGGIRCDAGDIRARQRSL